MRSLLIVTQKQLFRNKQIIAIRTIRQEQKSKNFADNINHTVHKIFFSKRRRVAFIDV